MNKTLATLLRIIVILIVIAIAGGLRARAVNALRFDYDEYPYTRAAQEFAHLFRTSDWRGFMDTNAHPEHPPLVKILFGLSLLSAPERPLLGPPKDTGSEASQDLPRELVNPERTLNAILGTLTVAILAIVDPLGSLVLALHTFTIKYDAEAMLEALPALASLGAALTYLRWKKQQRSVINLWLLRSAVFLGLTVASKYIYCVVGIAILVDWTLTARRQHAIKRFIRSALIWGAVAIAIFFLFDPYLWPSPIQRLQESVFFHATYTTTAQEVQNASFPFWYQFVWLSWSPYWWPAGKEAFLFPFDGFILLFAVAGLKPLWNKERLYVLWLAVAISFLLVWPTKWPQYLLILTVPLSLAAAEGLRLTWENMSIWWKNRKTRVTVPYKKAEINRALPWLTPGLIAFAVLTLFPLLFQLGVSFTDFNVASLRDGLQGGIWPAIFGASHVQSPGTSPELPFSQKEVNFVGPAVYLPALGYITGNGILVFNILWTVLTVSLQTALGLGLALLLWQRGVRFGKFWQVLFILPWAIPEMIGAAMWWNVFQPDWGWLALASQKFGPHMPFNFLVNWYESSDVWLIAFILPALWYGFPFLMLAASTGLKLIPQEVYDAAAIDGASSWQTFRTVTWPLLLPLLLPAIIIRGIFAFNQFYLFQAYFWLEGTLSTTSYNLFNTGGFHPWAGQFALSAVVNILAVIFLIGFVIVFNRWSKAGEGVTYA